MTDAKRSSLAKLALLTVTLIWGMSFVVLKNALDDISPHYMLAIRFGTASVLMVIFFWKKLRLISRKTILHGIFLGAVLMCAYSVQTIGLTTVTPGTNAFLTAVYCVIVPFLNWAAVKRTPTRANVIAAVLCLTGIGLISLTGNFTIAIGDLLTLTGGVLYAVHIVAVSRYSADSDIFALTIVQFATSAVMASLIAVIFEKAPRSIAPSSIGGIIYLAVGATFVCLLLQNVGQKYTDPSSASLILSLESVFGVFFSIIFYNEQITARIGGGFALIFAAVLLSEVNFKKLIRKSA